MFDVLWLYRGVLFAAVVLAVAFAIFDQIHEVYLTLAEDVLHWFSVWCVQEDEVSEGLQPDTLFRGLRLVFSFVLVILTCIVFWMNGRWLSLRYPNLAIQKDTRSVWEQNRARDDAARTEMPVDGETKAYWETKQYREDLAASGNVLTRSLSELPAEPWWDIVAALSLRAAARATGEAEPYKLCWARAMKLMPRFLGALPAFGMALGLTLTALSNEARDVRIDYVLLAGAILGLAIAFRFLSFAILRTKKKASDSAMFWRVRKATLIGLIAFAIMSAIIAGSWTALAIFVPWCVVSVVVADAAILVVQFLMRLVRRWFGSGKKTGDDSYDTDRQDFTAMQWAGFWLVIFITAMIAAMPVTPAQMLGTIGLICLFGIGLSVILTWLTHLSKRYAWPFVGSLLAWSLLLSMTGWNDNHRVMVSDKGTEPPPANSARAGFDQWAQARQGGEASGEQPLFVVAAQGGGLYAAYHTAIFLARAQDLNTRFADHLFAVSSVSGGSLGAAVFHAILTSGICSGENRGVALSGEPGTCFVDATRKVFRRDFLSPVVGSLLFTDFTARFLPNGWGATDRFDRARALEAALVAGLKEAGIEEKSPLFATWDSERRFGPAADTKGPATGVAKKNAGGPLLLLNSTDVDSGGRMVLTPLRQIYTGSAKPVETFAEMVCSNISDCAAPAPNLLSAAVVSARFPYITPAAGLSDKVRADRRFVDGGYFEASAVETAMDLLMQIGQQKNWKTYLFVMDFPTRDLVDRARPRWMEELMSPIRAIFNARGARSELSRRRAENLARPGDFGARDGPWQYCSVSLDDEAAQFTLGWSLSTQTFDQIEYDLWNDELHDRLDDGIPSEERRKNREYLKLIETFSSSDAPGDCDPAEARRWR